MVLSNIPLFYDFNFYQMNKLFFYQFVAEIAGLALGKLLQLSKSLIVSFKNELSLSDFELSIFPLIDLLNKIKSYINFIISFFQHNFLSLKLILKNVPITQGTNLNSFKKYSLKFSTDWFF